MKNWNVYEWIALILAVTVAIVYIIIFLAPVIMRIPTTAENSALRGKMIDQLGNITIAIIALLVYKLKENDKL